MPLVDVEISIDGSVLPDDVIAFLREADLRVSKFARNSPIRVTGFVPSDFVTVYQALRAITEANLTPGTSLCEWGSGFGVVASLAAMLGLNAWPQPLRILASPIKHKGLENVHDHRSRQCSSRKNVGRSGNAGK